MSATHGSEVKREDFIAFASAVIVTSYLFDEGKAAISGVPQASEESPPEAPWWSLASTRATMFILTPS